MTRETAEEQRQRAYLRRLRTHGGGLIKCLECNLWFVRVGSHVVQVHGYETARDYKLAHGLDWKTGKDTASKEHRQHMGAKAKENGTEANLEAGAKYRFTKDGRSRELVSNYWKFKKEFNELSTKPN